MTTRRVHQAPPVLRVASLLPYVNACEVFGASSERLLTLASIPPVLVEHPSAAVPLETALRFAELACRALGTEHLALEVARTRTLDDYGPYGKVLQQSLTVHEYLHKGIALYRTLQTGQQIWLSRHGSTWRFHVATLGGHPLGAYQAQLETLVITLKKLREAVPDWSPDEISLEYRSQEDLPNDELFANSRVLRGTGTTYFTIPAEMMGQRFPSPAAPANRPPVPQQWGPLPEQIGDLVQVQVDALLCERGLGIDMIAESLFMSPRTLQRGLAEQGLSYSQLLTQSRLHRAAHLLETTEMPIAEIAFSLGYSDASNFTRAFRRRAGVSPKVFRDRAVA